MPASRRQFLSTACRAVSAAAATSAFSDLLSIAEAAAPPGDFKALVCVFLYGGNDSDNMIVPRAGADYTAYATGRGAVALPQPQLLPITPVSTGDGRLWGLHPQMPGIRDLFASRRAAIVANVGPLVAPVTKSQWDAGTASLPPQLYSHSDQSTHWESGIPDRIQPTGWGGRIGDRLASLNAAGSVSIGISVAGTNTMQVGDVVAPFQIGTDGTLGLDNYTPDAPWNHRARAIRDILAQTRGHLLEDAFRGMTNRAIEMNRVVGDALAAQPPLATAFPDTYLARQLRMCARLIGARSGLGHRRQIFFVSQGGYDTHGGQLAAHVELLGELSGALKAFQDATVELGVANSVTAFTASDFGRTWITNGEGTDHGWGGHHLVVGGAVRGGEIYGAMPALVVDGPNDSGDGRWIPTTSVDTYAATLAKWFGVPDSDLGGVFPNLGRFPQRTLAFLP